MVPPHAPPVVSSAAFTVGEWVVDPSLNLAARDGVAVHLRPKVMDLLACLAAHPGQVVSKQALLDAVWGTEFVSESALTTAITELRHALADGDGHATLIETVPKRGYRLVAPVARPVASAARAPLAATPAPEAGGAPAAEPLPCVSSAAGVGGIPAAPMPGVPATPGPGGEEAPVRNPARWRPATWHVAGAIAALLAIAFGLAAWRTRVPAPHVTSVAVLPLEDRSQGPAYFADGITEELTTEISRLARLEKVINRRSVMQYKDSTASNGEIARELGVDALIIGSVFRSGDRVRITAQLVYARDDRVLWAGAFERQATDVLLLQREVVRDVIASVGLKLVPAPGGPTPRTDPVAYDDYLRGLEAFNTHSARSLEDALACFRRAVWRDPALARAHAALAVTIIQGRMAGLVEAPYDEARSAARAALALDDTIGEAHAALGAVLEMYDWDWTGADRAFTRAVALSPNSVVVRTTYAHHLGMLGRAGESIAEARRAVAIDPTSVATAIELLWAEDFAGHAEACVERARQIRALGEDPLYRSMDGIIDRCEASLGRADAVCARGRDRADCGFALARAGRVREARRVYESSCREMDRDGSDEDFFETRCLQLAAVLGDREPMLRWTERLAGAHAAAAGREPLGWFCAFFRGPDVYGVLKDEPRFRAVLRRIGLPE